ncbi:MAG TPA: 3-hydroxyacyl-CoA dehydrogenase family protein [Actinomycetota bacterium]
MEAGMTYTFPADIGQRPVTIVGAGTLGRRIAAVYAAGGADVHVHDMSAEQLDACRQFISDNIDRVRTLLDVHPSQGAGDISLYEELGEAVRAAWMVVESVPEDLELKRQVIGELDRLSDADAIVASNSSSLPTSQMLSDVQHRWRVLNTHYQLPPELNAVELMSCGETDEGVIPGLISTLPEYGLVPFWVRRESDGFILNRIWGSIKRECLMVVGEGVAMPDDVDAMWAIFAGAGIPPFKLMDQVGLDVVLAIEEHYASVRPALPEGPRELLREYLDRGWLGVKSGHGFYEYG